MIIHYVLDSRMIQVLFSACVSREQLWNYLLVGIQLTISWKVKNTIVKRHIYTDAWPFFLYGDFWLRCTPILPISFFYCSTKKTNRLLIKRRPLYTNPNTVSHRGPFVTMFTTINERIITFLIVVTELIIYVRVRNSLAGDASKFSN